MFAPRSRFTESIFECLLVFDVSDSSKDPTVEHFYPHTDSSKLIADRVSKFILPCTHKASISEEYTLIFTDVKGKVDYLVCLYLPLSGYVVCINSFYPWFELFHCLLNSISQYHLYLADSLSRMNKYLSYLLKTDNLFILSSPPDLKLPSLSLVVPNETFHPYYHRHILEYFNTLSISSWIVIIESLLLEKSIVFHSTRFQRITSSILASLSLLYPLTWAHLVYPLLPAASIDYVGCPTPFVAGVHSCMLDTVKRLLTPGSRLVDLDNDSVYTTDESEVCLPAELRKWLTRRCNLSHTYILRQDRTQVDTNVTAAAYLVEPYLELLTILLGGYRDALDYVEPTSPISPSGAKSGWVFDQDKFIKSRGSEYQAYLRELLNSQMVVQFMDSRVDLLNSEVGIIPQDDFEDCLARVHIPLRSNITDWLRRGRTRFGRLIRKLDKFKRPSSNLRMFKVQHQPSIGTTVSTQQEVRTSSRSSSDDELSEASVSVSPMGQFHQLPSNDLPIVSTIQSADNRWRTFQPVSNNEVELRTEQSTRTLISSFLEDQADLTAHRTGKIKTSNITPLPPPPQTGVSKRRDRPTRISLIKQDGQSGPVHSQSTSANNKPKDQVDFLSTFDPYASPVPPIKPTPAHDDLSAFLQQLDPLNNNNANVLI